jgi:hypothetical protein
VGSWLAIRSVAEELVEAVAQVVAKCEKLCRPEGVTLPDQVIQLVIVELWPGDCEEHWLAMDEGVLLRHWVIEEEGEPVPDKNPLGECDGLREAQTVGVSVLHTVLLSETILEEERDIVVVELSEGDSVAPLEAVRPAGELEGEAVPAAAPKVALRL